MKTAKIIVEVAAADADFTKEKIQSIQSEILSTCRMMFKDNGFVFDIKEAPADTQLGLFTYTKTMEKTK